MKPLIYFSILMYIGVMITTTPVVKGFYQPKELRPVFDVIQDRYCAGDCEGKGILISKTPLPKGYVITARHKPVLTLDRRAWFVFIDDYPGANFSHPCRYVLVSPDLKWSAKTDAGWPPDIVTKMILMTDLSRFQAENIRPVPLESDRTVASTRSAEHLWAVILSGGYDQYSNYNRYWNDCSFIYTTLTEVYGYLDDHIIVAISDGTDPAPDQANNTNSDPDLDGDGDDDIMFPCTNSALTQIFSYLASTLGSSDTLFIFTTDHGSGDGTPDTEMTLWNMETITDDAFADLLEPIVCREILLALEPCHSGGFVDDILDMSTSAARVIATACNYL